MTVVPARTLERGGAGRERVHPIFLLHEAHLLLPQEWQLYGNWLLELASAKRRARQSLSRRIGRSNSTFWRGHQTQKNSALWAM